MPIWKATARFRDAAQALDKDFSFNTHVTTNGTSDDAWSLADQVAEALCGTVMAEQIVCYSVSIYQPNVINGNQTRPVSHLGQRVPVGDALPNWNTVKVTGIVGYVSRPSIWHVRCGLGEGDVAGQFLEPALLTAFGQLETALTMLTGHCNKYGFTYTDFAAEALVRSRQQDWHRRTRPGFRRGWVAV